MRSETVVHVYLDAIEADLREQWVRMKLATNPETDNTPFEVMNAIDEEFSHRDINYGGYGSVFVSPSAFNNVIKAIEASYAAGDKGAILYLSMLTTRVNDEVMHQDRRLKCCIILHNDT